MRKNITDFVNKALEDISHKLDVALYGFYSKRSAKYAGRLIRYDMDRLGPDELPF